MACEQDYWNQMYANACAQIAPSLLWRPKLFVDGTQWCALYGDNLQDGVAGFGDTPDKAMRNFDPNWSEQKVGGGTTATLVHNAEITGRASGPR
jgi:hypothetical protein